MVKGPSSHCVRSRSRSPKAEAPSLKPDMVRLSVNVNKVATLRNSRGGEQPRVLDAAACAWPQVSGGITVHPRADQRHITPTDVRDIARRSSGPP